MGKHREQKQAAHVAKFQQKQSEHARKFNALDKSILGNFSDGTNYTLSGKAVGFGSRDFCVGALALNCIQVRLELETIRNNITQQLTFELARAIESEKKLVVKKGNSTSKSSKTLASWGTATVNIKKATINITQIMTIGYNIAP